MRIRIVESARRDLDEGYTFYESQEKGLAITSSQRPVQISRACGFQVECIRSFTATTIAFSAMSFPSPSSTLRTMMR